MRISEIKNIFKNIRLKIIYGYRGKSEWYVEHIRKSGAKIGKNVTIFDPDTCIDITRPWLLEIGDNVKITRGVTILTHGFDWSVLNGKYGDICGAAGKVKIGNNVFIGMQSTILKGVTIGDNVIIGANSLVNRDIPSNSVVAGNPVRVICSLEEYHEKRLKLQYEEAKQLAKAYKETTGMKPPREIFREFAFLFRNEENSNGKLIEKSYEDILHINNNYEKTIEAYRKRKIIFNSYEEFLTRCFEEEDSRMEGKCE